MGTIYQKKIVSTKSAENRGELVVESVWVTGEGKDLLKDTQYVSMGRKNARIIDQVTTFRPSTRPVQRR
jgi:hypothetical protein